MKNIENFDHATIKMLRAEYQAAIDAVSEKYGFVADLGRITFESNEFRCKLTVSNPTLHFSTIKKPDLSTLKSGGSLIGRRYKLRNSIYMIESLRSPGVYIGVTQRGKKYKIREDQLMKMTLVG